MIDVLIVEDDPMVAELNRMYLQRMEGFRLAGVVGTGQAALDFLDIHSVALLLLDVFMPELDGLSLLQEVRQRYPHTDIIMVTAARNSTDIQTALRLGVIDYIVKPFVFERFQASLAVYQDRYRLLHQTSQLDQEALDKRIFTRSLHTAEPDVPKGIDMETLRLVRHIAAAQKQEFSIKEFEVITGISRISLKKYLNYLQQRHEIDSTRIYSRIGRPVTMYRWTPHDGDCKQK